MLQTQEVQGDAFAYESLSKRLLHLGGLSPTSYYYLATLFQDTFRNLDKFENSYSPEVLNLHLTTASNLIKDGLLLFHGDEVVTTEITENIEQKVAVFQERVFVPTDMSKSLVKNVGGKKWQLQPGITVGEVLLVLGVTQEEVDDYGGLGSYLGFLQRWKTKLADNPVSGNEMQGIREIMIILSARYGSMTKYVNWVVNDLMVWIQLHRDEVPVSVAKNFDALSYINIPPVFQPEIVKQQIVMPLLNYHKPVYEDEASGFGKVQTILSKLKEGGQRLASESLPGIVNLIAPKSRELVGQSWFRFIKQTHPAKIGFFAIQKNVDPDNFVFENPGKYTDKATFSAAAQIYARLSIFLDVRSQQYLITPLPDSSSHDEQTLATFTKRRKLVSTWFTEESQHEGEEGASRKVGTMNRFARDVIPDGDITTDRYADDQVLRVALTFEGGTTRILKIHRSLITRGDTLRVIDSIYDALMEYKKQAEENPEELGALNLLMSNWDQRGTKDYAQVLKDREQEIKSVQECQMAVCFVNSPVSEAFAQIRAKPWMVGQGGLLVALGDPEIPMEEVENEPDLAPGVISCYDHLGIDGVVAGELDKLSDFIINKTTAHTGNTYKLWDTYWGAQSAILLGENVTDSKLKSPESRAAFARLKNRTESKENYANKRFFNTSFEMDFGQITKGEGASKQRPLNRIFAKSMNNPFGKQLYPWLEAEGARPAKLAAVLIAAAMKEYTDSIGWMIDQSHVEKGRLDIMSFIAEGFDDLGQLFDKKDYPAPPPKELENDEQAQAEYALRLKQYFKSNSERVLRLTNVTSNYAISQKGPTGTGPLTAASVNNNLSMSAPINEIVGAGIENIARKTIPNFNQFTETKVVISAVSQANGRATSAMGKDSAIAIAYDVYEDAEGHLKVRINVDLDWEGLDDQMRHSLSHRKSEIIADIEASIIGKFFDFLDLVAYIDGGGIDD